MENALSDPQPYRLGPQIPIKRSVWNTQCLRPWSGTIFIDRDTEYIWGY